MSDILSRCYAKGKHVFLQGDEATLPNGHLSGDIDLSKYNTVVYDTDAYSYETILKLLQQNPVKGLRLGTYSTKTKKFITEKSVHEWIK